VVTDLKKKVEIIPDIQGQVLKSARESLRIAVPDLAKKACLSKKHITELEEGGLSSFYSPEHKVRVARKVSVLLGLEENQALVYPGGDLAKQESLRFDTEVTELNTQSNQTSNNVKPKVLEEIKSLEAEVVPEVLFQKSSKNSESIEPKNTVNIESLGQGYSPSNSSSRKSWKPAISIFLILLVGAGLYVTKDDIADLVNPKPIPLAMPDEVLPEVTEDKPGEGPVVVPATQTVNQVTPTTSSPPLPSEAACPKTDAAVAAVSVFEPNKPGNFVFIQSKIKQTVCVSDASGKVTVQSLDAGGSHTFTGRAPFTVLSSGLNNLNMFFQGRPVRLSNEQARSVRLEEGKLVN
jgi:transcriptional regulator with XRE-family HTH domain